MSTEKQIPASQPKSFRSAAWALALLAAAAVTAVSCGKSKPLPPDPGVLQQPVPIPASLETGSPAATQPNAAAEEATDTKGAMAMQDLTLNIKGMTCEHCKQTITRVLSQCPGVSKVEVSLEEGKAKVTGTGLDKKILARAVEEAGYEAQ